MLGELNYLWLRLGLHMSSLPAEAALNVGGVGDEQAAVGHYTTVCRFIIRRY